MATVDNPSDPTRRRNPRGEGDRLRGELIAAASELLETLPGQESLSMRAVARKAGVAAPSVYRHFVDKQSLMLAVLQTRFGHLAAELAEAAQDAPDAEAALRARCQRYVDFAARHPGHYAVMFNAVPVTTVTDESELPGAELITEIASLVARAWPQRDPRNTALLLWCGLHGIATLRISKPKISWPDADVLVEELLSRLADD